MAKTRNLRNKKYRPKKLNKHAHETSILMFKPINQEMKDAFIRDIDIAILAISNDVGTSDNFFVLATMIEISLILVKTLFNEAADYEETLTQAKNALYHCQERSLAQNQIQLDEAGLEAIKASVPIYTEILGNVTIGEFANAIRLIELNLERKNYYRLDH